MVPGALCTAAKSRCAVRTWHRRQEREGGPQPSARSTPSGCRPRCASGRRGAVAARAAPHLAGPAGHHRPARERGRGRPPRHGHSRPGTRRHAERAPRPVAADERAVRRRPAKVKPRRRSTQAAVGTPEKAWPRCAAPRHWCRRAGACCSASASTRGHALPGRPARRPAAAPQGRQAPAGARRRDGIHVLHLVRRRLSSTCAASPGTRRPR
jgi:hypothetical protein